MIRIVHADDHPVVRQGLSSLLQSSGEIEVIAQANNGADAVNLVVEHKPDIALMDLSMPELDGLGASRKIRNLQPKTRILILTMHESEHHARQALRAGADGYLSKATPLDDLLTAMRRLMEGEKVVPASLAKVLENPPEEAQSLEPWQLTRREFQVLCMLADSKSSREVAQELSLSVKTVDSHRAKLLKRLDLRNNSDLTRYAIRNNLIEP